MFVSRLVLVCLWGAASVQSLPYLMLTSTRSKCVSVNAPQRQTITISYHAPDMKINDEVEGNEQGGAGSGGDEIPEDGANGHDTAWDRRMKEKLDRMKSKEMRDMTITVTQSTGLSGALAGRQRRTYVDGKVSGQGKIREELSQRQGTFEFLTKEGDGAVEICVQSIVANRNSPSRVALNVTMKASTEEEEEEKKPDDGETSGEKMEHAAVKTQMSRLERDLQTLSNRVKAILNNADFNKDQQVAFQQQSEAMNSAAFFWPIIQLTVVVVTGFTQANHIVRYMKTHHIGI